MNDAVHFSLELEQIDPYEFRVRFDVPEVPDRRFDESRPLRGGQGRDAPRRRRSNRR